MSGEKVRFAIEKVRDKAGSDVNMIVKYTPPEKEGGEDVREEWCSTGDLDALFDTCVARWGDNWDLNKVLTAIREADFD